MGRMGQWGVAPPLMSAVGMPNRVGYKQVHQMWWLLASKAVWAAEGATEPHTLCAVCAPVNRPF